MAYCYLFEWNHCRNLYLESGYEQHWLSWNKRGVYEYFEHECCAASVKSVNYIPVLTWTFDPVCDYAILCISGQHC